MISEVITSTIVTGGIGLTAIMLSRWQCLFDIDSRCKLKNFRFGFSGSPLQSQEQKVSCNTIHVNSDAVDKTRPSRTHITIDTESPPPSKPASTTS